MLETPALVYGASGAVGTYAVQIAAALGAEVTGLCSTSNVEMVKSLGAARVIDYTREDFTARGETWDVIFDTVGKSPFSASVRCLERGGHYLLANPGLSESARGLWTTRTGGRKVIGGTATASAGDLLFLRDLIEAGKLRSVIDRIYPLERIVEAHRYVEEGHKKGNVVITVPEQHGGGRGKIVVRP